MDPSPSLAQPRRRRQNNARRHHKGNSTEASGKDRTSLQVRGKPGNRACPKVFIAYSEIVRSLPRMDKASRQRLPVTCQAFYTPGPHARHDRTASAVQPHPDRQSTNSNPAPPKPTHRNAQPGENIEEIIAAKITPMGNRVQAASGHHSGKSSHRRYSQPTGGFRSQQFAN